MFRLGSRTAAKTISVMAAAISVAAVLVFYAVSDPAHGKFHPKCLFHLLTGLECPGCGSQRALHCLLNGDLFQALHYNALMVAAIPYAVLYAVSLLAVRHAGDGSIRTFFGRILDVLYRRKAAAVVLAVVCLFWVARNFTAAF